MENIIAKVKEWAMKPVFGVPAAVIAVVVAGAAWFAFGRKKGSGLRLW